MPKSILRIDKFEGGINSNTDPKDLQPNEVADARDAYLGKKGQIGNIGLAKVSTDVDGLTTTVTPGYGLGYFKTKNNFGIPASGTSWGEPVYTNGHNGLVPFFNIQATYFKNHPMQMSGISDSQIAQHACENWGLRIHIGGTVGTPEISFPTSDDNGSATVDGDSISYRIIDDGTRKWFGLFPQTTLESDSIGDGNWLPDPTMIDYGYWFSRRPGDTIGWDYELGDGNIPIASGYGSHPSSNLLKALAGMIAKQDNISVTLYGDNNNYEMLKVHVDYEQWDDYTPSNKYVWIEFRQYADPNSINSGGFPLLDGEIRPITHIGESQYIIEGNYVYSWSNEDYNFLTIPQMFDAYHSSYGDASKQIQTTIGDNAPVTNLMSEGYLGTANAHVRIGNEYPVGANNGNPSTRLARRVYHGVDPVATSYVISLANTAGTDATSSGETYKIKLTGHSTPETGTEVSQAYHSPNFDTFTEVTAALATAITGAYGGELVTNGDMDTAGDWEAGTGWAVNSGSSGVAQCSSGTGAANALTNHNDHLLSLSTSTYYKVQFDVVRTSGTLYVDLGDTNGTNKQFTEVSGANQVFIIKTPGTLAGQLVRFYGGNFIGTVDNVSVKALSAGIGGLTASSSGAQLTISTTGTGQNSNWNFEPSITRASDIELKNVPTDALVLIDANSDMHVCDLSYKYWMQDFNHTSASNTKLYWQDAGAKPQFFSHNGILRFSDSDFDNTNNNPKWFGHINKNDLFNQTGTTDPYDIKGWFVKDQAQAFPANPSDWIVGPRWDETLSTPASKIDIKIANPVTENALWEDDNYKFHITAVFDDDSETLPSFDDYLSFKDASNKYISVEAGQAITFECSIDPVGSSGFSFDERMKGFRIYFSKEREGYANFYELGLIDFKEGFIRADGIETKAWANLGSSDSDATISTVTILEEFVGKRYQDNTSYAPDNRLTHVKWKACTVVRNRCWVGNVQYKNETGVLEHHPNLLYASPFMMLDTILVDEGLRDYGIVEGDAITQLENFSDRVLVFTNSDMLIINVAELDSEFLEESHRFKGVSNPNHVVRGTNEIIWANEYSVYVYNGESVEDLMMISKGDFEGNRNISRETWGDFFNTDSLLAYEPKKNQVIIKRGTSGSNSKNNGDVYVFDLDTKSWSFGADRFVTTSATDTPKDTNMLTTKDGNLYMINGRTVAGTALFNPKEKWGQIDEGGEPSD